MKYTCELCRIDFEALNSDEEAMEEFKKAFPECVKEDECLAVVCDTCYDFAMKRISVAVQ